MTQTERDRQFLRDSALVSALNRYGHHDHDCDHADVFDGRVDCKCGFNRALSSALVTAEIPEIRNRRILRTADEPADA